MPAKYWRRNVCGFFLLLFLIACATPLTERLERVQVGMDKTQVLDLAGNPRRTQRQADGDLWTFVYYIGDRHFERDVRFESGHVVSLNAARDVTAQVGTTQGDVILKDYENLVHEAKRSKAQESKPKETQRE